MIYKKLITDFNGQSISKSRRPTFYLLITNHFFNALRLHFPFGSHFDEQNKDDIFSWIYNSDVLLGLNKIIEEQLYHFPAENSAALLRVSNMINEPRNYASYDSYGSWEMIYDSKS